MTFLIFFMMMGCGDYFEISNTSYQKNYYIRHISRDSLVSDLRKSKLKIELYKYVGDKYNDEHAFIYGLNDTIDYACLLIQDFDKASQTVHLKLIGIAYQDSIFTEPDGRKLPEIYKEQLLRSFEREMFNNFREYLTQKN